ncbi:MAG: N-acetylneuraminate synthase [Deltaproteobacteria bacterium]|nr:N-acetylneuraminate synthase [Deltaproteobacteria bacterium]
MVTIRIGSSEIGVGNPCFIIAEAGVNHNGDINLAKKLIDVASNAKANAIKFQTFVSEDLVAKDVEIVGYQKENIGKTISQLEMLKNLELSLDEFRELKNYCDEKKIIFLSTLHTYSGILEFMDALLPAYKIGSGDLTNFVFLEKLAKRKKPMILGTGMATLEEVMEACELIKRYHENIIMLHATTNYPCPLEEVNLNAMKTMQEKLDCLVGYSDHTEGITVPIMAVAMGAVVIEKHFTFDKNLPGPDHKASLDPQELTKMIAEVRRAERALGSHEKIPVPSEIEIMKAVRKSVVARVDIEKGMVLREEMLAIKRPATGISPKKFYSLIGKRLNRSIKKDQIIREDMLEEI